MANYNLNFRIVNSENEKRESRQDNLSRHDVKILMRGYKDMLSALYQQEVFSVDSKSDESEHTEFVVKDGETRVVVGEVEIEKIKDALVME